MSYEEGILKRCHIVSFDMIGLQSDIVHDHPIV